MNPRRNSGNQISFAWLGFKLFVFATAVTGFPTQSRCNAAGDNHDLRGQFRTAGPGFIAPGCLRSVAVHFDDASCNMSCSMWLSYVSITSDLDQPPDIKLMQIKPIVTFPTQMPGNYVLSASCDSTSNRKCLPEPSEIHERVEVIPANHEMPLEPIHLGQMVIRPVNGANEKKIAQRWYWRSLKVAGVFLSQWIILGLISRLSI